MNPQVKCVIMGGGRGTRLHPLTKLRCKPAVPLGGKYRLADIPISNCLNSGLNQIFVLTQFNTASLHRHIQEAYKFDAFGKGFVDILSAEQTEGSESWYQGTADAVRQNLHHFGVRDDDLVLILSGDQLYRMNFDELLQQHTETDADVTIAGTALPTDKVEGLGLMRINDDLSITEFVEKPTDPEVISSLTISDVLRGALDNTRGDVEYCLANMGIYLFKAGALREALAGDEDDFGKEIIPGLLGRMKLYAYAYCGYWEDIGTVRAFWEANLSLTDDIPPFNFFDGEQPVYTNARYLPPTKANGANLDHVVLGGGCILTEVTATRSIVGVRGIVGEGSVLKNTVVMGSDWYETDRDRAESNELQRPDLGIGKNCRITDAIVDKNVRIGDDVVLTPEGKPDKWNEGPVYVRDGVLIVLKDAVVPSGTRVCPED
ncbi:MAG: glucose-1-phosphate adenylyltransferase [Opitutales bacterium]